MEHYDFSKVNSFFDVELHEYQKKAISAILNGLDCFVGQPTASGKSLIFQSIPVIKDGSCVIVVQPLIALMKDQINSLTERGMKVLRLAHDDRNKASLYDIQSSQLIFASPEALLQIYRDTMQDTILGDRLACLAVDESHIVVKW